MHGNVQERSALFLASTVTECYNVSCVLGYAFSYGDHRWISNGIFSLA